MAKPKQNTVIIPARYGSTRFPGKPLHPIAGVPMLQRVWALAKSAPGVDDAVIATDDDRIAQFAGKIGAQCVMTAPEIRNGTERVAAALDVLGGAPDVAVNLQGDAALTAPWVLQKVLQAFADPAVQIATPATQMSAEAAEKFLQAKKAGEAGGTTVVFGKNMDALYFSKSPVPFNRPSGGGPLLHRHIGLYAYRPVALKQLVALPPGPLEQAEQLEQLRALENGIAIRVVPVDYRGRTHWGVDSEEDARRAEALIKAEGELLPVYDGSYRFTDTA
ncbi:MAG: 3-deoxy-manno-octulosonate cytidylyltransferase [Alphaproteobacteria bacterium]|nr:3-deoxy-manno-octulosonate cytidylyltransferase [Alphaproteobacteria bacterium]